MPNKEAVKRTAISYWSDTDKTWVAESSLLPHVVIGIGVDRKSALRDFDALIDIFFESVTKEKEQDCKIGRPTKGYQSLNVNVHPNSKSRIAQLAKAFEISQGEIIDYLVFYRECKLEQGEEIFAESSIDTSSPAELTGELSPPLEEVSNSCKSKGKIEQIEYLNSLLQVMNNEPKHVQNVSNIVPFKPNLERQLLASIPLNSPSDLSKLAKAEKTLAQC